MPWRLATRWLCERYTRWARVVWISTVARGGLGRADPWHPPGGGLLSATAGSRTPCFRQSGRRASAVSALVHPAVSFVLEERRDLERVDGGGVTDAVDEIEGRDHLAEYRRCARVIGPRLAAVGRVEREHGGDEAARLVKRSRNGRGNAKQATHMNQPTNQPTNQSSNQPTNQSSNQPINQPVHPSSTSPSPTRLGRAAGPVLSRRDHLGRHERRAVSALVLERERLAVARHVDARAGRCRAVAREALADGDAVCLVKARDVVEVEVALVGEERRPSLAAVLGLPELGRVARAVRLDRRRGRRADRLKLGLDEAYD